MPYAIETLNLTKQFEETIAIRDLSITLSKNKICGLLGRNGAGKTTLLHLLASQSLPSSGKISIFGEPVNENKKILDSICFVPGFGKFVQSFRVRDFLNTAKKFYPNWDQNFADDLVEQFELSPKKRLKELSSGMISMVSIIISMASRAPVTLLDEPYTGLDASARQLFYDILAADYAANPRTIVFSTHLIDEASRLFEEVILIDQGSLVFHKPIEELEAMSFAVRGESTLVTQRLASKNVINQETLGCITTIAIYDTVTSEEISYYVESGLQVQKLSLQQLFVYLTAKTRGLSS